MKKLTQDVVIGIMREEWQARVKKLAEQVDVVLSVPSKGGEKIVISPELKVLHKGSGIRYTVDTVSPREVVLRTPEGDTFLVDKEELEKEYELD